MHTGTHTLETHTNQVKSMAAPEEPTHHTNHSIHSSSKVLDCHVKYIHKLMSDKQADTQREKE